MALSEQRILQSVTHQVPAATLEVEWRNQVLRDGEVIADVPHRKAYTAEQRAEFEAEVEGAAAYVAAAGWEAADGAA